MRNIRLHSALIVFLLGCGLAASPASAQPSTTHYVDDDVTGGDGSSWPAAFQTLQEALDVAGPGDDIRVAAGRYIPTSQPTSQPAPVEPRQVTFLLADDLSIYGGYAGASEPDNPDLRHFVFYESILSGDLNGDDYNGGDNSENAYHVVTAEGLSADAVLDGFTIVGGNANDVAPYSDGGGLYVSSGNPAVSNCVFLWCEAYYGGAVYVDLADPTLTNCTFLGNAALVGGAVYAFDQSDLDSINCQFIGNTAVYGGGLCTNIDCWPSIINATFAGNEASWGAAIYNHDASRPTLANCILWGDFGGFEIINDATSDLLATYSCIQGGWPGDGNIDQDPGFLIAPDPGPDAEWGTDDDDFGDLHPASGGWCVDAGDGDAVPAEVDQDCLQNPRFFNDPNTPDSGVGDPNYVDMGAIEHVDCNANNVPDDLDIIRLTCPDCNSNGIPDECDIASGFSDDDDGNGIPDECEEVECPGDLDGDGDVDLSDLATLLGYYGITSGAIYENGDLDVDGDVDLSDLAALLGYYGTVCQ